MELEVIDLTGDDDLELVPVLVEPASASLAEPSLVKVEPNLAEQDPPTVEPKRLKVRKVTLRLGIILFMVMLAAPWLCSGCTLGFFFNAHVLVPLPLYVAMVVWSIVAAAMLFFLFRK